ncbi:MAG: hypothetical protein HS115_14190 [Spirochaetales bacterium]|nr:hypothetical protein [Spirochaetales bacterium]
MAPSAPYRFSPVMVGIILGVFLNPALLLADTSVSHGRIQVTLPGDWQKKSGKTLELRPRDHADALLMIVEPASVSTDPATYLSEGVQKMEAGRKILKAFPARPQTGKTKNGVAYTFWGIRSSAADGERFSGYYAFHQGDARQVAILLCGSQETYTKLLKEVSAAFEHLSFQADDSGASTATAPLRPLRGRPYSYFNFTMHLPSDWTQEKGRTGGEAFFLTSAGRLQLRVPASGDTMRTALILEPVQARNAADALLGILTRRTDVGVRYIQGVRGWKPYYRHTQSVNGGELTTVAWTAKGDDQFYTGGAYLQGNGYALAIGTGMRIYKYDLMSHPDRVRHDHNRFAQIVQLLASAAASLSWTGEGNLDQEKINWLTTKKTLRYSNERSASSGSMTAFFSKQASWDFHNDRTANYKIESLNTFLDVSTNAYGRPDHSSGSGESNARGNRADFEVRQKGNRHYLILRFANGSGSVHDIGFQPFVIDSYQDGCCS